MGCNPGDRSRFLHRVLQTIGVLLRILEGEGINRRDIAVKLLEGAVVGQ